MMVAGIKAYQDAGVDHMVLALNSGDVFALKRLIKTIANEVPPEFPWGFCGTGQPIWIPGRSLTGARVASSMAMVAKPRIDNTRKASL